MSSAKRNYRNFVVSVYTRSYEVQKMADLNWLKERWKLITSQCKVDKIYLETHRDLVTAEEKSLVQAKRFFEDQGVQTAGGITYTINESNRFETFCYTRPEIREKAKWIAEYTAKHFDEFILDDFFFTSCKCEACIRAKGDRTWTRFRLELMREAGKTLIIDPAKAVNPKVKVIIKYPNWYEHFQGLGFDLEQQPAMFDGIYTGTETRHPTHNGQHLQQYESYGIIRYFENIAPGRNGGGWVDPFGIRYLDRYAEQLWLTLFAKAREITLFDFRSIERPITMADRAAWQGQPTSFDFDATVAPYRQNNALSPDLMIARAAGATFEQVDKFLGELGNPIGIRSYKPYHSTGEDFLHNYLGMIGLPIEIVPEFPESDRHILLTECAASDPDIVAKIQKQLLAGKQVTITSGLLRALQGKGIEQIAEIKVTDRKLITDEFYRWGTIWKSDKPILLSQIDYLTNDSWEVIGAGAHAHPLFHQAGYAKGTLNILTIPDDPGDLYHLPAEALNLIRDLIMKEFPVRIEAPGEVALFAYDNDTVIIESFRPTSTSARVIMDKRFSKLRDLQSGDTITGRPRGSSTSFDLHLWPHSYRVLRAEP